MSNTGFAVRTKLFSVSVLDLCIMFVFTQPIEKNNIICITSEVEILHHRNVCAKSLFFIKQRTINGLIDI